MASRLRRMQFQAGIVALTCLAMAGCARVREGVVDDLGAKAAVPPLPENYVTCGCPVEIQQAPLSAFPEHAPDGWTYVRLDTSHSIRQLYDRGCKVRHIEDTRWYALCPIVCHDGPCERSER